MDHVLCLIADPAREALESDLVDALAHDLRGRVRWLAEAEAATITVARSRREIEAEVADALRGLPFDRAVLPAPLRPRRLLLCDMDSTIITVECIDELAARAGIGPQVAEVTRRTMNGEIDFAQSVQARVALLEGLAEGAIDEVLRTRVQLNPGARTLVHTMRAKGALTMLISGGFTQFTRAVRAACGFDRDRANELEIVDGRLSGRLVGPVLDGGSKLRMLQALCAERGHGPDEVVAVGDGANDLPMLHEAGLGVAFRAHPRVAAEITPSIHHGDLTAALYFQGIARKDFADV